MLCKKLIVASLLVASLSIAGFAKDNDKDRERIYDAPFDKVWAACVRAANEEFTLAHSEKASGVLTFTQTLAPGSSERFYVPPVVVAIGVTVIRMNDTRQRVLVSRGAANVVGWIWKKYFGVVDQLLKE
jgi:hypothetical protein